VKDIVIDDMNELTPVNVGSLVQFPVKAVIVNFGDHTYSKVRYDKTTFDNLKKEMFKI
jgi:hypothetical protein